MPQYRFSKLARHDLLKIADYTVDTWGAKQANRYIDGLVDYFLRITQSPGLGWPCRQIRPGYRRIEYEKHVILYRVKNGDIFISRVLHHRMLPGKHLLEDS